MRRKDIPFFWNRPVVGHLIQRQIYSLFQCVHDFLFLCVSVCEVGSNLTVVTSFNPMVVPARKGFLEAGMPVFIKGMAGPGAPHEFRFDR